MRMDLDQKEVKERISLLIKESGLTDSAFAKRIDVLPSNFSRKLLGTQKWTINDVKKVCDHMHVSKDWLIDGVGDVHISVKNGNSTVMPNIEGVLPNIPIDGNKESYLDVVMTLFNRYMNNEQRYQEIIKENQKIMQQITFIYNKIKEG